jgi:hypothetical protein
MPKSLTKNQRLEIYEAVLRCIQKDIEKCVYNYGLCFYFTKVLYATNQVITLNVYEDGFNHFPEIQKHEPNKYDDYWFPLTYQGHVIRLEVLNKAIKKLNHGQ